MKIRKTAFLILNIFLFLSVRSFAQDIPDAVSLSGVVVDQATLSPIPNVTIKNASRNASSMADSVGFFSLTARAGDTLIFEAMLYSEEIYIVPESFSGGRFAVIEAMHKDKLLLEEVTVRAFPNQMHFEQAFFSVDPGDIADNTLVLQGHLKEVVDDPTNMQQYILDYNNHYAVYRITREAPPNNFLNPERWAAFIRDWRDGRFSDRAVDKLEGFPSLNPIEEQRGEVRPITLFPENDERIEDRR